jgi:mono/diheme cytochrome c family protein
MRKALSVLIGLAVSGAVLGAQAPDPKKAAEGEKIFAAQKCGNCHMVKGVGGKTSVALDKVGAKLSAADLRGWLVDTAAMEAKLKAKPKVSMAGFMKNKKLTDPEIDALVAYMQTLK